MTTTRLVLASALAALLAGCAATQAGLDDPTKAEINRRAESTAEDARSSADRRSGDGTSR